MKSLTTIIKPQQVSRNGFTLLEVLVSTVILSVLLLLLIGMTDGASRLWRDGEHRRESLREATAGLQMIAGDLRSAVLTSNPASLLIESSHHGEEQTDVPSPETSEEVGNKLFFLISHSPDHREIGTKGDLCAVGYFVERASHNKGPNGVNNLYRFHVSGREVMDALEKDTLRALYARASPSDSRSTELLARNIVSLNVMPLDEALPGPHPEALSITIAAINGDTARLLSADPSAKQRNDRLILRHLQRFSTIVHLPPIRDSSTGL
jgi:prepilin-type N-terminal cleavage/methylation domain-containing protein